jgi:hypothetical protein
VADGVHVPHADPGTESRAGVWVYQFFGSHPLRREMVYVPVAGATLTSWVQVNFCTDLNVVPLA